MASVYTFVFCLLVNFAVFLQLSQCYITRLPCKRHGNFSKLRDGFYRLGNFTEEINGVTNGSNCATYCVARDACDFINYNFQESICHLMMYLDGFYDEMAANVSWKVYETGADNPSQKGPFCLKAQPDCPSGQMCVDTCESPFYECVDLPLLDLTSQGTASQKSDFSNAKIPIYGIDGLTTTEARTQATVGTQWWQLDLGREYYVYRIYHQRKFIDHGMKVIWYVGKNPKSDSNKICFTLLLKDPEEKDKLCDQPIVGRYVIFYKKDVVAAGNRYLSVKEMRVYGLPYWRG